MEKKLLAVSVIACILGGCATTTNQASDQPRDDGVLVTGSRLPQRSSTGSASVSQSGQEDWRNDTRGKQVNPQGR